METHLGEDLLDRCRSLANSGEVSQRSLLGTLKDLEIDADTVEALMVVDASHPYGRRVLFENAELEAMVATWTPGKVCAPHDHGGSIGAVKVLRGKALHTLYKVESGALKVLREEQRDAGELMVCGRDIVHAMGDGGEKESLVTLHLYSKSIDHMVVYDANSERTVVVDGGCGAWIPDDEPHLIRSEHRGIVPVEELV